MNTRWQTILRGLIIYFVAGQLLACARETPPVDPSVHRETIVSGVELGRSQAFSISVSGNTIAWIPDLGLLAWHRLICRRRLSESRVDTLRLPKQADYPEFQANVWNGEQLVIPRDRTFSVSVDPGDTIVSLGRRDQGTLSCLDCLELERIRQFVPELRYASDWVRALVEISVIDASAGVEEFLREWWVRPSPETPSDTIVRRRVGEVDEVIHVDSPTRGRTSIESLRASPDGRFLAYAELTSAYFIIPLPPSPTRIWVQDLETGDRRLIGRANLVSNMIWNWEGTELYVAGRDRYDGIGCVWKFSLPSLPHRK